MEQQEALKYTTAPTETPEISIQSTQEQNDELTYVAPAENGNHEERQNSSVDRDRTRYPRGRRNTVQRYEPRDSSAMFAKPEADTSTYEEAMRCKDFHEWKQAVEYVWCYTSWRLVQPLGSPEPTLLVVWQSCGFRTRVEYETHQTCRHLPWSRRPKLGWVNQQGTHPETRNT